MTATDPVTVGFDPGASIKLRIDRTLPDDGREHLVELAMRRCDDGGFELVVEHDGDEVLVIAARAGFLFAGASVSSRTVAA